MKKHISILFLVLALALFPALALHSQSPQGIPYQAVMRNADGSVMASSAVNMTFMIHDGTADGTVVYQESHSLTSNAQGLVTCVVGNGVVSQGNFENINWGNGAKFLHVMMGTTDLGTQQMLSVPYALYASAMRVAVSATGDTLTVGGQSVIVPGISAANTTDFSALGSVVLPIVPECQSELISINGCGGQDSLLFDGYYYELVEVAGQCWFKENLRSVHYNDGTDIGVVSSAENPNVYVPDLTIYPQAVNYGNYYSALSVMTDKLCPTGWHIPTHCDWSYLESQFGTPISFENQAGDNIPGTADLLVGYNWVGNQTNLNSSGLSIYSAGIDFPYNSNHSITLDGAVQNSDPNPEFWTIFWLSSVVNSDVFAGVYGDITGNSVHWPLHREIVVYSALSEGSIIAVGYHTGIGNGVLTDSWNSVRCLKDAEGITEPNILLFGCEDSTACNYYPDADIGWIPWGFDCKIMGATCDDYNSQTVNDIVNDNCECVGTAIVNGCTNSQACNYSAAANVDDGSCLIQGASCDDGNANTTNDVINGSCVCAGTALGNGTYIPGNGATDIDGNTYTSIIINGQEWMQQNLAVTKYRNGDPIPTGLSNTTWQNTTSGAYAIYNNDAANNTLYGKLYNWYAVNDSRGLCPTGWHVPSDAEWTTLETNLGGNSVAGGKMKATTGWNSPNTGATNSSGFTAFPGGYRLLYGTYDYIGANGYWWSSTEFVSNGAWNRGLYYSSSSVSRSNVNKLFGFSVRCVRD